MVIYPPINDILEPEHYQVSLGLEVMPMKIIKTEKT